MALVLRISPVIMTPESYQIGWQVEALSLEKDRLPGKEEVLDNTATELNLWADVGQREQMIESLHRQEQARVEVQLRRKSGELCYCGDQGSLCRGHQRRTADLARAIAGELGLAEE